MERKGKNPQLETRVKKQTKRQRLQIWKQKELWTLALNLKEVCIDELGAQEALIWSLLACRESYTSLLPKGSSQSQSFENLFGMSCESLVCPPSVGREHTCGTLAV